MIYVLLLLFLFNYYFYYKQKKAWTKYPLFILTFLIVILGVKNLITKLTVVEGPLSQESSKQVRIKGLKEVLVEVNKQLGKGFKQSNQKNKTKLKKELKALNEQLLKLKFNKSKNDSKDLKKKKNNLLKKVSAIRKKLNENGETLPALKDILFIMIETAYKNDKEVYEQLKTYWKHGSIHSIYAKELKQVTGFKAFNNALKHAMKLNSSLLFVDTPLYLSIELRLKDSNDTARAEFDEFNELISKKNSPIVIFRNINLTPEEYTKIFTSSKVFGTTYKDNKVFLFNRDNYNEAIKNTSF